MKQHRRSCRFPTLTVRETQGIDRAHVAVFLDVSFAKGQLTEIVSLAGRGPSGETTPSQFDVLAWV